MSESTTFRPRRPSRLEEQEAKRDEGSTPEGKASPVVESTDVKQEVTETKPTDQAAPTDADKATAEAEGDGEVEVDLDDVMSRSSKFSKHFTRIDAAREATKRGKAKQMATENEESGKTLIEELRGAAYAKGYGFRGKIVKIQGKHFVQYAVPDKREKKSQES